MLSEPDFLQVCDRALTGLADILEDLGDDLANDRPELPRANSPFGIVTHCLGVLDFWVGGCVAGREVVRDRAAEFTATGQVADLVARVRLARGRLADDIAGADLTAQVTTNRDHPMLREPISKGAALLHAYEELDQHHGQLELTRDVLRNAASQAPRG